MQGFQCASNKCNLARMEELEGSARGVSLRAAACMLAGDARDPVSGERVRRAVDAQLRRAGVEAQDAGDVRTEVVLALLSAPAAELPLPLELVCARAAVIARNKADRPRPAQRARADRARRRAARARAAQEHAAGIARPTGSTRSRRSRTGGACAPISRAPWSGSTRPSGPPSRAHAEGGAARAAGLPRSTYYRALAHAQARLRSDLRGRLAGLGVLGGGARARREIFAHVEAVHAAAAAATAAVAISAAVALSAARRRRPPGRPRPRAGLRRPRRTRRRQPSAARARPAAPRGRAGHRAARPPRPGPRRPPLGARKAPCIYDPSTYDC